jgi:hypothetical protein
MNSEKVKEIKEALGNCQKNNCVDCPYFIDEKRCRANDLLLDTITLINNLECINKLQQKDIDELHQEREKRVEEVYADFMQDYNIMRDELNEACEHSAERFAEWLVNYSNNRIYTTLVQQFLGDQHD